MKIDRAQAVEIARRDAETAYRDLSPYDIVAIEKDGQWRVTFVLKDKDAQGGGAQYIISADRAEDVEGPLSINTGTAARSGRCSTTRRSRSSGSRSS